MDIAYSFAAPLAGLGVTGFTGGLASSTSPSRSRRSQNADLGMSAPDAGRYPPEAGSAMIRPGAGRIKKLTG
jgi:hypothetical protein